MVRGMTFQGRKADVHKTLISASKAHSKSHVGDLDRSPKMFYVKFQTKQPRCACSKRKAPMLLTRRSKTNACRLGTVIKLIVRCVQEHHREPPGILHWGKTDERGRGSPPHFVAGGPDDEHTQNKLLLLVAKDV